MDTVVVLSPLSILQDGADAPKKVRLRLPNGNDVTVIRHTKNEQGEDKYVHPVGEFIAILKAAGKFSNDNVNHYEYVNSQNGKKFHKWNIAGALFQVELEPTGDHTAKLVGTPALTTIESTVSAEDNAMLDGLALQPPKQKKASATAGGFADAVAAASDPLVG